MQYDVTLEWVLDSTCEPLHTVLQKLKRDLNTKITKVRQKQIDHESEILDQKKLKSDIVDDFKKLQTSLTA